jgi:alkylation response protein AidB-like acyl-CoA dehydrogenase
VFGRPIGQNQAIQHPLAECWANLEAAWWMTVRAGALYDTGHRSGAEANAAKLLGARAGHAAALQAVKTMGGMGYSREYQVERLLRESLVPVLAPVSEQMILSFLSERVLDLPKSY